MGVSYSFVRQTLAAGAGNPVAISHIAPLPALSPRMARREALVKALAETLRGTAVLWLHGRSNLGTSQLSRLLAARGNAHWAFVSLKARKCVVSGRGVSVRVSFG